MPKEKDPRKVAAGRKGGQRNVEAHGADRMRQIAREGGGKGGRTTLARYGREHFQRMARRAAEARQRRRQGG